MGDWKEALERMTARWPDWYAKDFATIRAHIEALEAGERKLVPMEPTEKMIHAGRESFDHGHARQEIAERAYKAMVAAAGADGGRYEET